MAEQKTPAKDDQKDDQTAPAQKADKEREQTPEEAKKEAGTSNSVIAPGNGLPTI